MGVPATTGQLRTKVSEMEIGDYIPCTAATGSANYTPVGHFANIGIDTGQAELPLTGSNTVTGMFYFIKVAKGILISDRVTRHSVSWEALNLAKYIQGVPSAYVNFSRNLIPLMTSNTSPGGVASASSEISGYEAWKAFDRVNNSEPSSWATSDGNTGWITYEFPEAKIIKQYSIWAYYNTSQSCHPKSWSFEGTNDGVNWDVLDRQADVPTFSQGARYDYSINNSKGYKKYRLNITKNNGHSFVAISGLEMFEVVGIIRSLTGGVAYADAIGNKSMTDQGYGGWPTNNEWDKYIVNFPKDKIQQGKELDDVFHFDRSKNASIPYTFCQDTPVNGFVSINGFAGTNAHRIVRVKLSNQTVSHLASNTSGDYVGFRPVFEYKEV